MDDLDDFDMEAAVNDLSDALFAGDEGGVEGEQEGVTPADNGDVIPPDNDLPPADPTTPDPAAADATTTPPTEAPSASRAPDTWTPVAAAEWAKIPPVVQDQILKREQDMFRGLEQYREAANFGKQMNSLLAPYKPMLDHYKIDPFTQINALMAAHYTLAAGSPEQKVELFKRFAADYGVNVAALTGGQPAVVDPVTGELQSTVQRLQSQLQSVQSFVNESTQAQQQQRETAIRQSIGQFAAQPGHEYFDLVASDMATLIRVGAASNLDEAYDKAVWANSRIRSAMIQAQQTQAPSSDPSHAERAARARGVNVRATPRGVGGAASPVGSLDDTLAETMESISRRG
jgi:hypothetical protein